MNRVWSLLRWVREKVNVKLALVTLVVGTGLFTAYQCYARFGKKAPLPEPIKVVTGGGAPVPGETPEVAPAAAEVPLFGGGGNDAQSPSQPPTQPAFAFNANAFGPPSTQPPTQPDAAPPAPVFGTGEGAPARLAPYQPAVAGDPSQQPYDPTQPAGEVAAQEAAPLDPNEAEQPPADGAYAAAQPGFAQPGFAQPSAAQPGSTPPSYGPVDAAGLVPSNPIRGGAGASLNDNGAAEQPVAIAEQPEGNPAVDAGPNPAAAGPYGYEQPAPVSPNNGPPTADPAAEAMAPIASAPAPRALGGYGANSFATSTSNAPNGYESSPIASARENHARGEPTGQGKPGDRQFEGAQTPALTLEKIAPAEIQVGKLATFELRVKNVGQIPAQQVQVTDHIPRGTQLVESKPPFQRAADGSLVWPLGNMQPGDEQVVQLQVMPQTEGEIGSVAQVTFAASATARSICTRPLLTIEHTAPPKLLIGETLNMTITVTNPGTGAATGVVVEEDVPPGLSHASGSELEYEIGTLRPGESKRMELTLRADKAGVIQNTVVVRGDGNLAAQHQINVEVVAPQLQVGITGPKRRFLERPATYTVSVSNPGTASARDVEVVAYLPRGMKFVDTDSQGTYDPQQHCVFWNLDELPATKAGNVKLTAVPLEVGDQKLRIEGRADLGLNTAYEQVVSVDAAAELIHTIADLSDPIEVGSDTTYEVRVTNVGTKTATNIRIAAMLPPELKALSGEGPTRAANDGSRVIFEPLARLNPQEEAIFRIQANALKAGDFIVKVQISSNEWPNPVTREESTRVYLDR